MALPAIGSQSSDPYISDNPNLCPLLTPSMADPTKPAAFSAAAGDRGYWRFSKSDFFPERSFRSWSAYTSAVSATGPRLRDRLFHRSTDDDELNALRLRSEHDMKRCLTWWDLIWIGFGSVVGTGIFVLTGQEARESAGPAIVLSYAAAGLSALLSVFCYTEFAVEIPAAGGSFSYLRVELGEFVAFIAAANILLEAIVGAAGLARSWTSYFATLINRDPDSLRIHAHGLAEGFNLLDPLASVVLITCSTLATLGTRSTSTLNWITSILSVAVIAFIIAAGSAHADSSNLTPFFPMGAKGVFEAAAVVYWAYTGFDMIATLAEETKTPSRDIPIGLVGSMSAITVVYCIMSLILVMMQKYSDLDPNAAYSVAFASVGMRWAKYLVALGALKGMTTGMLVGALGQARYTTQIARAHMIPPYFALVHSLSPHIPISEGVPWFRWLCSSPYPSFEGFVSAAMGALEEGRFDLELRDNGLGLEMLEPDHEPDSGFGSGSEPAEEEEAAAGEIEDAVRVLLSGLGEDQEREGIKKTPHRVAKALREGTRGYRQKVKDIVQGALFPEAGLDNGIGYAGGAGGLVVVRDIDLYSYCECCLLPFGIKCHVGYVPSGHRVVGLSKLSRVADVFAKRLQEPQRLADELCSALHSSVNPSGVAVALQCWHIQFPEVLRCNSNPKHPSKSEMQGWLRTSVCSKSGVFEDAKSFWDDFSALLNFRGISLAEGTIQSWCPSRSLEVPQLNGYSMSNVSNGKIPSKAGATQSSMIAAVASVLRSLGEDPLRKELLGTPYRHVQWLMNFRRSNFEMKLIVSILSSPSLHDTTGTNGNLCQSELHSELNLPFCSQCEHHLLPFHGVVHVGYSDEKEGRVIERSVLQSLVHFYGCKLQVQERLTRQIAEAVYSALGGGGVMVVVEANHICMISRGIEKVGSSTATIALVGDFTTNPTAKATFLQTISKTTASGG